MNNSRASQRIGLPRSAWGSQGAFYSRYGVQTLEAKLSWMASMWLTVNAEEGSFIKLNLVALAFTLGAIFAFILALGAVVLAPIVLSYLGLGGSVDALVRLARWPALMALVVLGLTMLYRYGPSLSDPQWTWLFPGNILAAVAWLAVSALFSWYIASFGNYDATYGSLGGAIGMMTWMWISTIVGFSEPNSTPS